MDARDQEAEAEFWRRHEDSNWFAALAMERR